MKFGPSVLASVMALALTLASVACACPLPVPDAQTAPAPHSHHHGDELPQGSDCMDSGCGGNGGIAAAAPERGSVFAETANPQWDDDLQTDLPAPDFIRPFVVAVAPIPPPRPPQATSSPVARFDKLLN